MADDTADHAEQDEPSHPRRRGSAHAEADETPSATADVEALMGLRDFLTIAPRRRTEAGTAAAHAALKRWMTLHGHSLDGFYTPAEWQAHYQAMLSYSG